MTISCTFPSTSGHLALSGTENATFPVNSAFRNTKEHFDFNQPFFSKLSHLEIMHTTDNEKDFANIYIFCDCLLTYSVGTGFLFLQIHAHHPHILRYLFPIQIETG